MIELSVHPYVNIIIINNLVLFPYLSTFPSVNTYTSLDLDIDDYAKMWLQLASPFYLFYIAIHHLS